MSDVADEALLLRPLPPCVKCNTMMAHVNALGGPAEVRFLLKIDEIKVRRRGGGNAAPKNVQKHIWTRSGLFS